MSHYWSRNAIFFHKTKQLLSEVRPFFPSERSVNFFPLTLWDASLRRGDNRPSSAKLWEGRDTHLGTAGRTGTRANHVCDVHGLSGGEPVSFNWGAFEKGRPGLVQIFPRRGEIREKNNNNNQTTTCCWVWWATRHIHTARSLLASQLPAWELCVKRKFLFKMQEESHGVECEVGKNHKKESYKKVLKIPNES